MTAGYIALFQGTPLLMQLFVVYYGLALYGVKLEAWVAVAIGFTLHASAYLGEIWRGAIEAVPRGQVEAAKALSLGYFSRMKDVVLPQAFRISLPATIGFLVQLIKGTSLAAICRLHRAHPCRHHRLEPDLQAAARLRRRGRSSISSSAGRCRSTARGWSASLPRPRDERLGESSVNQPKSPEENR